jgi:hypothetical protein
VVALSMKERSGMNSVYGIDKENFETFVDETGLTVISDEAWDAIADEIQGRVDNYMEELLHLLAQDYLDGEYGE